jgi:hypothetical protein
MYNHKSAPRSKTPHGILADQEAPHSDGTLAELNNSPCEYLKNSGALDIAAR